MRKRIFLHVLAMLFTVGNTITSTSSQDNMIGANDLFRQIYAQSKQAIINSLGPVIILDHDKMTLINKGKRVSATITPPRYHALKTVDHIPLTTFVLLSDNTNEPLDKPTLAALETCKAAAQKARGDLTSADLAAETMHRQIEIMNTSINFIDKALSAGSVTQQKLNSFAQSVRRASMGNGANAVAAQISALNETVTSWKKQMSPDEWDKVYVIRMSGHMPRHREVTMQYFEKLLGEKREGNRIIYAENVDSEARALDLLATHILDQRIAQAYFDSPWRMHEDLLSDVAEKYLRKHPPGR